jgi:hypothetical protein
MPSKTRLDPFAKSVVQSRTKLSSFFKMTSDFGLQPFLSDCHFFRHYAEPVAGIMAFENTIIYARSHVLRTLAHPGSRHVQFGETRTAPLRWKCLLAFASSWPTRE